MVPASEILTAVVTGVSVVALSVGATLYVTNDSSGSSNASDAEQVAAISRRFDIGDAYFPCRDQLQDELAQNARNVNVDSRSSRYDDLRNDNVVYIDLQLVEGEGSGLPGQSKEAQVVCRVSASNNEVTYFQVRKS